MKAIFTLMSLCSVLFVAPNEQPEQSQLGSGIPQQAQASTEPEKKEKVPYVEKKKSPSSDEAHKWYNERLHNTLPDNSEQKSRVSPY